MPREENRREMEYEAPTSSQRDSEVSNSYTGSESNPQDNKVCTHIFKRCALTSLIKNQNTCNKNKYLISSLKN